MSKRIVSVVVLSLVVVTSAMAAPPRPASNAGRGDDSPIGRTIQRIVKALGHLLVSPFDDGPFIGPPNP
jgi:hypothetical protein